MNNKFNVGDTVYEATTYRSSKMLDCPDCLGEKKWRVISPAGGEYETACLRCGSSYRAEHRLSLQVAQYIPQVITLTIGSVRSDSLSKTPFSYMCLETGVGSGRIYYEDRLFSTKEEAQKAAEELAAKQSEPNTESAQWNEERVQLSDYRLEHAMLEIARKKVDEKEKHISELLSVLSTYGHDSESIGNIIERYRNGEPLIDEEEPDYA